MYGEQIRDLATESARNAFEHGDRNEGGVTKSDMMTLKAMAIAVGTWRNDSRASLTSSIGALADGTVKVEAGGTEDVFLVINGRSFPRQSVITRRDVEGAAAPS